MNNRQSELKKVSVSKAKRTIGNKGNGIVKDLVNPQEECKAIYLELAGSIEDLESKDFGEHWYHRAKRLKELGCGKLYKYAIKKAEEYRSGGVTREEKSRRIDMGEIDSLITTLLYREIEKEGGK